jgi:hypothetical protein
VFLAAAGIAVVVISVVLGLSLSSGGAHNLEGSQTGRASFGVLEAGAYEMAGDSDCAARILLVGADTTVYGTVGAGVSVYSTKDKSGVMTLPRQEYFVQVTTATATTPAGEVNAPHPCHWHASISSRG